MEEIKCKSCGNLFQGKFCNQCGEKVITAHDKTLFHFVEEATHFFTHFEGRFITTLKTIFRRPGKLSQDYADGKRKKYFPPLSFFMLLVVIYLLFPIFQGLNLPFSYIISSGSGIPTAAIAKQTGENVEELKARLVQISKERKNIRKSSELELSQYPATAELAKNYDKYSEKFSKLLLLILIPLSALLLSTIYYYLKKPAYDHAVLATEICSMFLLIGFILMPLVALLLRVVGIQLLLNDGNLKWLIILFFGTFVFFSLKRFYAAGAALSLLNTVVFLLFYCVCILYL